MKSALIALSLVSAAALADTDRLVNVTGTCLRSTKPDRGSVTITAETLEKNPEAASKKTQALYESFRTGVKELKLENMEIETTEYTLQEAKEWENNKSVSHGFRARMGLKVVTTSIAKLGEVIQLGARLGLRDAGGLSTYLSRERYMSEQAACLEEAAKNAKARAVTLTQALGARVGKLMQISESTSDGPVMPIRPLGAAMKSSRGGVEMMDATAPQVESSSQTISVTVNALFAID